MKISLVLLLFMISVALGNTLTSNACWPRLSQGTGLSLVIGNFRAFDEYLQTLCSVGLTMNQITIRWRDIETSPGVYDWTALDGFLQLGFDLKLDLVLNLVPIDTTLVVVPSQFADPQLLYSLPTGLTWTDPHLIGNYSNFIDGALSRIEAIGANVIQLGLGHEITGNMIISSQQVREDYLEFIRINRERIRNLPNYDDLSVGVSVTLEGLQDFKDQEPSFLDALYNVTDGIPVSYYPLIGLNSTVPDISVVEPAIDELETLLSMDKCIGLQELGCPAGYNNELSVNNGSFVKQAAFIDAAFDSLENLQASGRLRFVSYSNFADLDDSTCLLLSDVYFDDTPPGFTEYFCTLGITNPFGNVSKPALDRYIERAISLSSIPLDPIIVQYCIDTFPDSQTPSPVPTPTSVSTRLRVGLSTYYVYYSPL